MSGIFYVYISVAEVFACDDLFDQPENTDTATKSATSTINSSFLTLRMAKLIGFSPNFFSL